jgi:hypothetical protein
MVTEVHRMADDGCPHHADEETMSQSVAAEAQAMSAVLDAVSELSPAAQQRVLGCASYRLFRSRIDAVERTLGITDDEAA